MQFNSNSEIFYWSQMDIKLSFFPSVSEKNIYCQRVVPPWFSLTSEKHSGRPTLSEGIVKGASGKMRFQLINLSMLLWLCLRSTASKRCFQSPVGGSECSQVWRRGGQVVWDVCSSSTSAPVLRSLGKLTWFGAERSGRQLRVCACVGVAVCECDSDRVAAGQIRKVPVAALRRRPRTLSSVRHKTGDTLWTWSAGRAWPEDPLLYPGCAGGNGEAETTFIDFRAMNWQYGQVVQGAPRIQNYQSTPSGATKTGLQTLSHRCARSAWLPANWHRGYFSESSSAGHPRCLQTTKGVGLRGPVHYGWKYFFRFELEHCGPVG